MDSTLMTLISTVAIAGAAALKVLWARVTTQIEGTAKALEDCHGEHKMSAVKIDSLHMKLVELSGEVGEMRGRILGFQEAENLRVGAESGRRKAEDERESDRVGS